MLYEKMTHTQIPKNYTENTYTKIMTYMQKIWWNMSYIVLIAGHKWSYPHRDDQSTMRKRKTDNDRNITESK